MTSMEFFHYNDQAHKVPIDWGTTEARHVKLDPTLYRAPTFLTKKQTIDQLYRVSALQLSDNRAHDQVEPRSLELDMNLYQNPLPFPMQHPLTSQISNKAMFPNYTAPEDPKHGEAGIRSNTKSISVETKTHPDPVQIVNKTAGQPWRHEIQHLPLPTQREGAWWIDKELYQNPKPDRVQQYYPAPTTILGPNHKLRNFSSSLDPKSWNMLRNKERELLQTTHQIDFYKDGLGTRAPLNTDNYDEKNSQLENNGQVDDTMKPYFKRGVGLSSKSLAEFDDKSIQQQATNSIEQSNPEGLYTQLDVDEYKMQVGNEYVSYPTSKYNDIQRAPTFNPLERSHTMPVINTAKTEKQPSEKALREMYFHNTVQNVERMNRLKNLELITPDRDIRLLRIKNEKLENSRGAQPNLKQNINDHVNTLYDQEYKYLGERAELYKTSYNPYELQSHITMLKPDRTPTTINGYSNKKDVVLPGDKYEHRPKLFADRVFNEYHTAKRAPLEHGLLHPETVAPSNLQENGFILKQTEYGTQFNTKKFLQENDLKTNRLTEPLYSEKDNAELDYQNIALRSKIDEVAFNDYKTGLTSNPQDYARATEIVESVDKYDKQVRNSDYPRYSGPIVPEPYEPIYCTNEINEHTNGNRKREALRVYDSPFVTNKPRYEPLKTDLKTLAEVDRKNEEYRAKVSNEEQTEKLALQDNTRLYSIKDPSREIVSRRLDDKLTEKLATTISQNKLSPYYYTNETKCEPNNFYEPIKYTEGKFSYDNPHPSRFITLQDKWTKSGTQKQFLNAYTKKTADLRENYRTGKKPVFISPVMAAKYSASQSSNVTKA